MPKIVKCRCVRFILYLNWVGQESLPCWLTFTLYVSLLSVLEHCFPVHSHITRGRDWAPFHTIHGLLGWIKDFQRSKYFLELKIYDFIFNYILHNFYIRSWQVFVVTQLWWPQYWTPCSSFLSCSNTIQYSWQRGIQLTLYIMIIYSD